MTVFFVSWEILFCVLFGFAVRKKRRGFVFSIAGVSVAVIPVLMMVVFAGMNDDSTT